MGGRFLLIMPYNNDKLEILARGKVLDANSRQKAESEFGAGDPSGRRFRVADVFSGVNVLFPFVGKSTGAASLS